MAAAVLIDALHRHGVHHLTVHSEHGVHRIAITHISAQLPDPERGALSTRWRRL